MKPRDDLDSAPVADATLSSAVPVIDLSASRTIVAGQVADACSEWGFFQIVGHGLSGELSEAATEEARAFFTAPKTDKRALARTKDNPWGFYDRELTKNARDKKEIFDIGPDAAGSGGAGGPFVGETPWPVWRPQFSSTMRAYFTACESVSARLLDLIGEGLGVGQDVLRRAFRPSHTSFLRLNYYPVRDPLADETDEKADLGIHNHTDAGALTVLKQELVSGLQVYRDCAWHTVEPLADALVVNIGDMIQVWSNDRYRAPVHRVLAMQRTERLSLPFFYNPSYDAVVMPLADGPPHYRGIPWGEFRRRRADGDFANYGAEVQISDYRL